MSIQKAKYQDKLYDITKLINSINKSVSIDIKTLDVSINESKCFLNDEKERLNLVEDVLVIFKDGTDYGIVSGDITRSKTVRLISKFQLKKCILKRLKNTG